VKRRRFAGGGENLLTMEELCRAHGLSLTVQRRAILEAVADRSDHPTADGIYGELKAGHPEISRATVYRTLERLVEIGAIRKVCHPGSSVRYDPNMERHHHLICRKCGSMVDLVDPHLDRIPLPAIGRLRFEISDYSIQFRGLCKACRGRRTVHPTKPRRRKRR
jgi:Fur family transcriptional regulator, peroxide stress response regulator